MRDFGALSSGLYQGRSRQSRADMPRTAGRMGFSGLRSRNFDGKAQNQGPGKMAKYICVGAPLLILCVLVACLDFAQKRVFENRQIFAETTENVVPNCRGSKTHSCTVGFEIGHLRSGSNMVPKYFSLNWHFLSHSPSRRQGELSYFSCLFPFLAQVPFHIFHGCIFSAITISIFHFCCVSFLLVVFVFLLVSLLSDSTLSFLFLS